MGRGNEIRFWDDRWTKLDCALGEITGIRIPMKERGCNVADYVLQNGEWDREKISKYLHYKFHSHVAVVRCPIEVSTEDRLIWGLIKNGALSATSAYQLMCSDK